MYEQAGRIVVDQLKTYLSQAVPSGQCVINDVAVTRLTYSDAYSMCFNQLKIDAPFPLDRATEVLQQYPSILQASGFGNSILESLQAQLAVALLEPFRAEIMTEVCNRYQDFTTADVASAFETAVDMFDALPPSAKPHEVHLDTGAMLNLCDYIRGGRSAKDLPYPYRDERSYFYATNERALEFAKGLSGRSQDAKVAARQLVEATELLIRAYYGDIDIDAHVSVSAHSKI